MRIATWLLPVAAVVLAGIGRGEPANDSGQELAHEEKLLKDSGVATDGPGLVAFLKARALSDADRKRLAEAVRLLGDNSYKVREKASRDLIAAGRPALPYLRPALTDPDLELSRRAERCVETIEDRPYANLMTAAAHLVVARRPAGAAEALLVCLPWVDDEAAEEAVFEALVAVGTKDGAAEPALVAAASDKEALRRAAAAHVLGRAGAEDRKRAIPLLTDVDPRVRFHAAAALVQTGNHDAVPPLLALLADAPLPVAWQAEDLLCRLAEERAPRFTLGAGGKADRGKCRDAWEAWWKANGAKVDLARLSRAEPLLNLNLVCELDGSGPGGAGRLWEFGADGKSRWEITNLNRPIDAHVLSGGRVLVAEHGAMRVTERDRDGKTLWEHRTDSQPVSCQRLPNGNTFIATYNELLEVTRENKVVFSSKPSGMIYNAQKLRDGHVIFILSNNQVVELDALGKELHTVTANAGGGGGWGSVERLANGNYLVALLGARKVVEIDRSGKVVWECTVNSVIHATRLRSGNTLVACIGENKVAEYDRSGKEIWKLALPGRPFHVYRR